MINSLSPALHTSTKIKKQDDKDFFHGISINNFNLIFFHSVNLTTKCRVT